MVNKSRLQQLAQSKQVDGNQVDNGNGHPLANKKPAEKNNLGNSGGGSVSKSLEPMANRPEGFRESKRPKVDTEDKIESGNGISQSEKPEVVSLKKDLPSNGQMQQQAPVRPAKVEQREEIRKDGRRRIIPQVCSTSFLRKYTPTFSFLHFFFWIRNSAHRTNCSKAASR